jgi:hypothetical protein
MYRDAERKVLGEIYTSPITNETIDLISPPMKWKGIPLFLEHILGSVIPRPV